jgi:hypothetical protein
MMTALVVAVVSIAFSIIMNAALSITASLSIKTLNIATFSIAMYKIQHST